MGCSRTSHSLSEAKKAGLLSPTPPGGDVASTTTRRQCSSRPPPFSWPGDVESVGRSALSLKQAATLAWSEYPSTGEGDASPSDGDHCFAHGSRRAAKCPCWSAAAAEEELGVASNIASSFCLSRPGATRCLRAVHWPLFSMHADTRAASLTGGVHSEATRVLGPPVEAKVRGLSSLRAHATSRLPVKKTGLSGRAAINLRCPSRSALRNVHSSGGTPSRCMASLSSWNHRYTCWPVFARLRTTTGTPASRFRSVFRQRSRKFEKLLTAATRAGLRSTRSSPRASDAKRSSTICRSTGLASRASTISVTPSCFPKSRHWFPMRADACGASSSSHASTRRTRRLSSPRDSPPAAGPPASPAAPPPLGAGSLGSGLSAAAAAWAVRLLQWAMTDSTASGEASSFAAAS
mmetsp:Transcript_3014/g.6826  ORF Transcript_3014/g.6826 Transcript_3014/m.6826 type:complete len:406 (+) Transcript_3014:849-2066(+)